MDSATTHLIEYLLALFGFLAILTRFKPQLMMATVIFQVIVFLLQLYKVYKAQYPNSSIKDLFKGVFSHYFKTHPVGQQLAENSNLDEKPLMEEDGVG